MPILIIQLAILIAVAFIIGCILGRLIKGRKAADRDKEDTIIAAALSAPAMSEKPESIAPPKVVIVEETVSKQPEDITEKPDEVVQVVEANEVEVDPEPVNEIVAEDPIIELVDVYQPELFDSPLHGEGDNLTAINGIGKSIEAMLNKLGVFHYSQIAQWSLDQAAWVERQIGFAGRVTREHWTQQATKLVESTQRSRAQKRTKPKKAGAKSKSPPRTRKTQA